MRTKILLGIIVLMSVFMLRPYTAKADVLDMNKEEFNLLDGETDTDDDSGHHTLDTALYLSDDYIGQVLADYATAEENWYYFYSDSDRKISVLLEQPSDGDYDIILYKLDLDSGVLSYVASSGYAGNVIDRLSAVCDSEGYYFLQVLPSTASTAEDAYYCFIVKILDTYDSSEPNDNPSQCNSCTTSYVSITGTIDDVFDQDWTQITLTGTKIYQLELNDVPGGAQYTVNIYDENLDVMAALSSEGSEKTYASLSEGTYYVCIASGNNQYSATAAYTFKMAEVHSTSSTFYTTKGGHLVEVTGMNVYIDGAVVDLSWSFTYNINYTRIQRFAVTSSTLVAADSYKNGYFKDGQNMNSSNDCVALMINNFNMTYYCNNPYESWTKNFGSDGWTYFYIDADTGKTIGTDANYYHTNMNITNTFREY